LIIKKKGLRPFGVSFIYAGYDDKFGFQLYHSDPSGNYSGWKANCIGANSPNAHSILKQEYKEDMTLKEAKSLAVKVLSKTMDSTTLGGEKCNYYNIHSIYIYIQILKYWIIPYFNWIVY